MTVFLVGDLGTGSLRVALVDLDGATLAAAREPLPVAEPRPGWAEIDPEVWWRALGRATARVLEPLSRGRRPAALCLTGATRSQVLLDRDGRALGPAILFRDRRATAEAEALAPRFPTDNPALRITPFHPLARIAWVRESLPEAFRRLAHVLDPKDYLHLRLTGIVTADAVTASRLDGLRPAEGAPAWITDALALLDPPRRRPWEVVGEVTSTEPPFDGLRGLPVLAGAMDTWAAATGAGCIAPGQAYDVSGTSEAVGLLTETRVDAPGLVSLLWGEGVFQIGGPTQIGADSLMWAHGAFRVEGDLAEATERAGGVAPSDALPLFLPYLAGERAPVWQPDVRGAFIGLDRSVEGDGLLWATLEGVAHSVRDILATATRATGASAREVRISGGGARSDAWCQLRADVLGVPVLRTAAAEAGLIGVAMCAAIGTGHAASLAEAAGRMCRIDAVSRPRVELRELFERRARRYADLKAFALALART
jgi:xylulokinase